MASVLDGMEFTGNETVDEKARMIAERLAARRAEQAAAKKPKTKLQPERATSRNQPFSITADNYKLLYTACGTTGDTPSTIINRALQHYLARPVTEEIEVLDWDE